MRAKTAKSTLKLATARLEFSSNRRFAQVLHVIAVAALVFLVSAIGRQLLADSEASGAELEAVKQQNAALRADLARTRTELELERSTRAALARQVAELNDETNELQSRLAFFNAQTGRTGTKR
jgi:septal ring factor EnvC (AmiA/AmiB activator)